MSQIKSKPKANPNKPNFRRSNFVFRQISKLFDKLQKTFFAKQTQFTNCIMSTRHHFIVKMQNEPNLHIFLTCLTKEMKKTYSDFYRKEVKKTNPIFTISSQLLSTAAVYPVPTLRLFSKHSAGLFKN